MCSFIMSQGSLNPKIRFLGQIVCYVASAHTDTHTDRYESEKRGHPFRFHELFLPSIIKDASFIHSAVHTLNMRSSITKKG